MNLWYNIPCTARVLVATMCFLCLSCGKNYSEQKAIADVEEILGIRKVEIPLHELSSTTAHEDSKVTAYEFLLCKRKLFFDAEEEQKEAIFENTKICYNPFVGKNTSTPLYLLDINVEDAKNRKVLRMIAKGAVITGGVVIVGAALFLGIKNISFFFKAENVIKQAIRMDRAKHIAKQISKAKNEAQKQAIRNKIIKEESRLGSIKNFFKVGISDFISRYFIIFDGAFLMAYGAFVAGKFYFDKGRKFVFLYGHEENTYIESFPFIMNDQWHSTAKVQNIYTVMEGIKRDLNCDFSDRYKRENPLIAPPAEIE